MEDGDQCKICDYIIRLLTSITELLPEDDILSNLNSGTEWFIIIV